MAVLQQVMRTEDEEDSRTFVTRIVQKKLTPEVLKRLSTEDGRKEMDFRIDEAFKVFLKNTAK